MVPVETDWLRNSLAVSGQAALVARFRQAAAGAGVIPWRLDFDRLEEEWFLPMAAPTEGPRAISLQGARLLSRRLREAVALHHARALERVAQGDRRCPFDLHRLVPVPGEILARGPDDPVAQDWLWAQWGTSRALRHVRLLPVRRDRRQRQSDRLEVEFWSADWSPWAALRRLRRAWPDLGFTLAPDYAADG